MLQRHITQLRKPRRQHGSVLTPHPLTHGGADAEMRRVFKTLAHQNAVVVRVAQRGPGHG